MKYKNPEIQVDIVDRKEYPYAEHIPDEYGKPLCGTRVKNPILIEIKRCNPPEAICRVCRSRLATLARTDWVKFTAIVFNDSFVQMGKVCAEVIRHTLDCAESRKGEIHKLFNVQEVKDDSSQNQNANEAL